MEFWYSPPQGVETINDFYSRVKVATESQVEAEDTLIVAHGGVLRALLDLMQKQEYLTQNVYANARPIRFESTGSGDQWRFFAYSKSNNGFVELD